MKKPPVVVALLILCLTACSSNSDGGGAKSGTPEGTTTSKATPETLETPTATAPALSENQLLVKTFVDALDALDIEHSEPKRAETGALSKASYEMTVNGFDAGIQIFANDEIQASWVQASDSLGGVCVVIDGAALSLNSSEGVANSAEIAPMIAQEVGGEAHGD